MFYMSFYFVTYVGSKISNPNPNDKNYCSRDRQKIALPISEGGRKITLARHLLSVLVSGSVTDSSPASQLCLSSLCVSQQKDQFQVLEKGKN